MSAPKRHADQDKTALIVAAKTAFRQDQRNKTWVLRVAAIARMNAASKLAKAAMAAAGERKK